MVDMRKKPKCSKW